MSKEKFGTLGEFGTPIYGEEAIVSAKQEGFITALRVIRGWASERLKNSGSQDSSLVYNLLLDEIECLESELLALQDSTKDE